MIRCACGHPLLLTGALSITVSADEKRAHAYGVATHLGWIEGNPGSWVCPGCVRVSRRVAGSAHPGARS